MIEVGSGVESRTALAWAAGLFDGEGCISVRPAPRLQITIEINMVHKPTLQRFHALLGGRFNAGYEHRRNRRTQWRWRCTDIHAEAVLKLLRPYLVTKASEADLAIALRQTVGNAALNRSYRETPRKQWATSQRV